jgi:hypothetical protein
MGIIGSQNQNAPSNNQPAAGGNNEARPFVSNFSPPALDLRVSANQNQPASQNQSVESFPVRNAEPSVQPPVVQPEAIRIIPGLPDRYSGKIFRLQVGAYSALEAANRAAELVKAAGFNVELEYYGSSYRVMAVGIASVDVYQASVRLGSVGFSQIWVRE